MILFFVATRYSTLGLEDLKDLADPAFSSGYGLASGLGQSRWRRCRDRSAGISTSIHNLPEQGFEVWRVSEHELCAGAQSTTP
ncbi:MAG: hypothetical protein DRJ69_04160 [Thermoprotei archaeon]|nr:MAG: hypothetical protein DRJ69_04160 [Thermoprotei archaeon]